MKLWNGWGTEGTPYPLPTSAAAFLEAAIGKGVHTPDASFEQALAQVPASRLKPHALISTSGEERLRHARGHSMPDWIALRSGTIGVFPDGVAYPTSDADVRALLEYARQTDTILIPYGGGSSVVGHINPLPGDRPVLTVDFCRMNTLELFEPESRTAVIGAGARGPEVEALLNPLGFTLGHFPQSWEYSTLGGWVASRSVGTQCYYYGRIESLFLGGHVETPQGTLELPRLPASAAGPDLRQLVLGSEGRLGMITRAAVRIAPLPQREAFYAVFFPNWQAGVDALREIVQARIPLSMLRLSNAVETETTLQLSGKMDFVNLAHKGLSLIGIRDERCLLIFGTTGTPALCRHAYRSASAIAHAHGGFSVDFVIGHMWHKSRFTTPYLRNTLWDEGYAIDTLETALPWSRIPSAISEIQAAIHTALEPFGEKVHVFAHLSHMYTDGASMYITYLFRRAATPEETLTRWQAMKRAASETIVKWQGTISHQHGIGTDHAPWLAAEKGDLGIKVTKAAFAAFDPDGRMNPGKLV